MAELTYEQLRHKTLAELRDMAKGSEHEAVQGYTQMNKDHLVVAIAKALGIQHEHHSVVGIDKSSIKARIRELKGQREAAIAAHESGIEVRVRKIILQQLKKSKVR
jgi:hypothetical protein